MNQRQAVFLDLQGTLGGEGLGDIRHFSFYSVAAPAIRLLRETGLPVIVVTNQSHIAKGLFSQLYFQQRADALQQELLAEGAEWDAIYCCPHQTSDECSCIKPKPGLLLQAQRDFDLDLKSCYVVGDMGSSDMVLARRVGCRAILVCTGVGESSLTDFRHTWSDIEPDLIAADVLEAAHWIVKQQKASAALGERSGRLGGSARLRSCGFGDATSHDVLRDGGL